MTNEDINYNKQEIIGYNINNPQHELFIGDEEYLNTKQNDIKENDLFNEERRNILDEEYKNNNRIINIDNINRDIVDLSPIKAVNSKNYYNDNKIIDINNNEKGYEKSTNEMNVMNRKNKISCDICNNKCNIY